MDQRNQRGILDPADAATLEVEHRHARKLRKKQQVLRHRKRPGARQFERVSGHFSTLGCFALYTAFLPTPISIWRIGEGGRNKKMTFKRPLASRNHRNCRLNSLRYRLRA